MNQTTMLRMWVAAESAMRTSPRLRNDRGQATAEYALVVLGAAAVAMLLIAWATSTGTVSTLVNTVVDSVEDRI
jgi:Flp pilus assembly pilin Flp